jgi:hypothetical protein
MLNEKRRAFAGKFKERALAATTPVGQGAAKSAPRFGASRQVISVSGAPF